MSDHSSTPTSEADPLFSNEEVKQFGLDDAEAGRAIGKMLSTLFLYTVVAMAISAYVTYRWVSATGIS